MNYRASCSRMIGAQLHEGITQIRMDRNDSVTAFLGQVVPQLQDGRDLARRIDHHVPTQIGDFGGTQASLHLLQHDNLIADRVSGVLSEE